MKSSRLLILLIFIALASCNKDNDSFKSVGTITGFDGTECGCCGGYIIYIDDVRYLIDSMPKDSGLDLQQETFPLTVRLDWQVINSSCPPFRIDVLRIKKE
jgi:hypothetical protein